jgi:DNA-binding MarR family transcriptional regulator
MNDDNRQELIESVLGLDVTLQQLLRIHWPESWLRINLPLGSTRALLAIETQNARTPGRIAEVLGVSRTTVTGLIDRLESEGLLTRSIDPIDRRSFVLQLTEQGRTLIRQIDQFRRDQMQHAIQMLDSPSLRALETGLAALVRQMQTQTTSPAEAIAKEKPVL